MTAKTEYEEFRRKLILYDLKTAKILRNKLFVEAIKIRGEPKISHNEAMKVLSESEMDFLLKAQNVHNNLIIVRKTRGGTHYEL